MRFGEDATPSVICFMIRDTSELSNEVLHAPIPLVTAKLPAVKDLTFPFLTVLLHKLDFSFALLDLTACNF